MNVNSKKLRKRRINGKISRILYMKSRSPVNIKKRLKIAYLLKVNIAVWKTK